MDFELRELKSCDIFPMFKIMGKIGFKDLKERLTVDKVKEMMNLVKQDEKQDGQENTSEDLQTILGFNVIFEVLDIILSNLPSCENEIYAFVSSLSGMTQKQVKDLPMVTFTEIIIAIIKKDEFKDFFKVVSGLFK